MFTRSRIAHRATFLILGTLAFTCAMLAPRSVVAEVTVFGITTTNTLVRFSSSTPSIFEEEHSIQGLTQGEEIVAIDYRPCLCGLYGLSNKGGIYKIDPASGSAQREAQLPANLPLVGADFDLEFNAANDTLTITSDEGIYYSVKLTQTGVAVFGTHTASFERQDPNSGQTGGLIGAAYTDNHLKATTTTLYGLHRSGLLVKVSNVGSMATVANLSTTPSTISGFDIGAPGFEEALSLFTKSNGSGQFLGAVNLSTGQVVENGTLGVMLRDIAIGLGGDLVFESDRVFASERDGSVAVKLSRIRGAVGHPSVEYTVTTKGAKVGSDFQFGEGLQQTGRINFPDGITEATLRFTLTNDEKGEGNEEIEIVLKDPRDGAVLGKVRTVRVTVVDDDLGATGGYSRNDLQVKTPKSLPISDLTRQGVKAAVICSESCTTAVDLLIPARIAKKLKLKNAPSVQGINAFSVGSAKPSGPFVGQKRITARLAKRVKSAVQRTAPFSITVRATATDGAGLTMIAHKKIRLTR
jgi:hypothetical protein